MFSKRTRKSALATMIAATGLLAVSIPAMAAPAFGSAPASAQVSGIDAAWQNGDHRRWDDNRNYDQRTNYNDPVYAQDRRYRDNRGYKCRKKNGTAGLIVGGALGALLGREIDGGYERTTGTILGGAGGALLGRHVQRNSGRCR